MPKPAQLLHVLQPVKSPESSGTATVCVEPWTPGPPHPAYQTNVWDEI